MLAAATSPDDDGPTLLDVRTHVRSRLGQRAGDAAFAAAVRPLVASIMPSSLRDETPESFDLVDDAAEARWLRAKLHPGRLKTAAGFAFGLAGTAGGVQSVLGDVGLLDTDEPDGVAPGAGAGDMLVGFPGGATLIVRRRSGAGLTVFVPRS